MAITEFAAQQDIDIAAKMYGRHPRLGDSSAGPAYRRYMREIDMGSNRGLFDEDQSGVPLFEGRMIAAYDHRAKGYRSGRGRKARWDSLAFDDAAKSIQPQWYIREDRIPAKMRGRERLYRIGYCKVVSSSNGRTLIATLVPPNGVCGDSVPTFVFTKTSHYAIWLGVANSYVMDFLVRMRVSLNLTKTILDSLPFPRGEMEGSWARRVVPRVLRLICTAEEMVDFWNMAASDGWVERHSCARGVPGARDEQERRVLQAEIDACVARDVYGITRDELAYVVDSFESVRKVDTRTWGEYRTKKMVLRAYDDLPG